MSPVDKRELLSLLSVCLPSSSSAPQQLLVSDPPLHPFTLGLPTKHTQPVLLAILRFWNFKNNEGC